MYCEKCGAEIKNKGNFCEICGNKIQTQNNREESYSENNKRSTSKKTWVWIMLGLMVCGVLFYGIFVSLAKDGRTPDQGFPTVNNAISTSKTFEFKVDRAWATDIIKCPEEEQEYFGGRYLSPTDEKAVFYIVEFSFTNTSDEIIDERPTIQLVDSGGAIYDREETMSLYTKRGGTSPDYSVYDEGILLSEGMEPGLTLKGQCTFIIAKNKLDSNAYIMCSRPLLTANSTLQWFTGFNLGGKEKVMVSLNGSSNDVVKESNENIKSEKTENLTSEVESDVEQHETAVAEDAAPNDIEVNYIFPNDSYENVSWHSDSTGYYMIPYMDSSPMILFATGNSMTNSTQSYYANMTDIKRTVNGGLICTGDIWDASKGDAEVLGQIEVIWESAESVDFPIVKVADDKLLADTSMIGDDYRYYGRIDGVSEPPLNGQGIIPESSTRLLIDEDIADLSEKELRIAINEIYARYGRLFKDVELQVWFDAQPWYQGTVAPEDFDEEWLSQIEKDNIKYLQSKKMDSASLHTKKALSGVYEMKFGSDGGANIEIIYESGTNVFTAAFSGSYEDSSGGADGILKSSSNDIYLFYIDGEGNPALELQFDGYDQMEVNSLSNDVMGGMGFPGFVGVYTRTKEYPMP